MRIDEETQQQQLEVILNLNRLTKKGKLEWHQEGSFYSSPQSEDSIPKYGTYWKDYEVVIEEVGRNY